MNTLYYDIETKPDQERVKSMLDPYPAYDAGTCKMGNIKDEAKVLDKLAAHKAAWENGKLNQLQDALDRAALCPSTGSILCIQYAMNDGPAEIIADDDEKKMLMKWWAVVGDNVHRAVNWTGSNKGGNFDKNYLMRRSWAHGLMPFPISNWKDAAREFLADADWGSYYKLEKAARELGIKVEDTGEVTGKTFSYHWITNREEALKYAKQDVELVRSIWIKMMGGGKK